MLASKKNTSGLLCLIFMALTCLTFYWAPGLSNLLNEPYQGGWTPDNPTTSGGVSPTFFPEEWRGLGSGKSRYLYQDYEKVYDEPYTPRRQGSSPSCVGHAVAAAVDFLATVEVADGEPERKPPAPISASVVYGMSRQEIAGLGTKPKGGAHCVWGCRAVVEYGSIAMLRYPGLDLREYSTSRAQKYGKYGVPDRVEKIAKRHKVVGYIKIRSWEDLRDAIFAGCPIVVGSNQGFGKGTLKRDRDGFLNPPRRLFFPSRWAHAMCIIGMTDEGRQGALIINSWGSSWISGPKKVGDEPDGSFWADKTIVERMIGQNDTWALVGFKGWRRVNIWKL